MPASRLPDYPENLPHPVSLPDLNLGVGCLNPVSPTASAGADWLADLTLPLYGLPEGPRQGWLLHGWLVEDSGKWPLNADITIETEYEIRSIPLLELREDGWFKFNAGGPETLRYYWSHLDCLSLYELKLKMVIWSDLLKNSPVFFRSETPHFLRQDASEQALILARIFGDHIMYIQEMAGDWMRVQLKTPSDYCVDGWQGITHEGWVRWRDPGKGPWIWFFTRGC